MAAGAEAKDLCVWRGAGIVLHFQSVRAGFQEGQQRGVLCPVAFHRGRTGDLAEPSWLRDV